MGEVSWNASLNAPAAGPDVPGSNVVAAVVTWVPYLESFWRGKSSMVGSFVRSLVPSQAHPFRRLGLDVAGVQRDVWENRRYPVRATLRLPASVGGYQQPPEASRDSAAQASEEGPPSAVHQNLNLYLALTPLPYVYDIRKAWDKKSGMWKKSTQ
ncbi:hypothetical protein S7711_11166 [Stachybotrys chartarum IBT 7711]|uniref:Uncharacterized protein n=1 Tax=Stachybotrys chartarum (strain CBS 109288 / IBT 7711) TaxID=1280523 RepID=A0A084AK68_STACB|nr:hypothetical protein S7711_11166 [Stachybotrys chartarum IBT 7711]KFA54206.1 hypothetical protein S40293_11058 [Stachybotrys chartarum IBT 40293]